MKLVFIIGTGRCGSSLVHEIIAKHRDVGFISNIDDNLAFLDLKGRWNNRIFGSPIGKYTKKGRLRFAPSEAYQLISRQVSPVYVRPCRDLLAEDVSVQLENRFRNFFFQRYQSQGNKVFIHKYTGWSRIGFFSKIFPDAKFIHIVRDGRAVSSSYLRMPWWEGWGGPENWLWGKLPENYEREWYENNRSFVCLAGIGWKLLMDSFESSSNQLDESRYLQVRYEDFLDHPIDNMKRMLAFSEIDWTSHFEKSVKSRKLKKALKNTYEADLTSYQLEELNNCLDEKLKQYGYLE
ncbi:MAG: sulfotransferase [Gammaproteobacteria bacterium]